VTRKSPLYQAICGITHRKSRLETPGSGTTRGVDPDRYGELTDEFEQMYSAEAIPPNGSVIISGDIDDLLIEMVRYLVTRN
jgi:hypothetical protein